VTSFSGGLGRNYIPHLPGDSKIVRVSFLSRKIIPDIPDADLVNNPQGFRREGGGS
jgi:hypothetical protein